MITKIKVLSLAVLIWAAAGMCKFVSAREADCVTCKYPDYASIYLKQDKYEKFNRKMFNFNLGLNKYAVRPVHIIWASVMPKYGMDRIQSATTNIEYPIRLVSCLVQKDFKASGTETVRFFTNTTLGLGGMFDPAKKIFKIEPVDEDMEQALAKCRVKSGSYLVMPVIVSTCPRGLVGKLLNTACNPSSYVGSPILAMVKAGLVVNKTTYMQPIIKMVESTYADPYDIAKKFYGLESYLKLANLDRAEVLQARIKENSEHFVSSTSDKEESYEEDDIIGEQIDTILEVPSVDGFYEEKAVLKNDKLASSVIEGRTSVDNIILKDKFADLSKLQADINLEGYNPQSPVVDALRTGFFEHPDIDKSVWSEFSLWNRSFGRQVKDTTINVFPGRENYRFRYIMQKDKSAPVAIIYPSIGEGWMSHHSVVLAKIFYEEGYSVVIQGSHFQWEFAKSMPAGYKPGLPSEDADYLRLVSGKILNSLEQKYHCKFKNNVLIGTSFGAMTTLFIADKESRENTLNISKFISVNPPVDLLYAMRQMDENTEEWDKNHEELKKKVAITAAKIIQAYNQKDSPEKTIASLKFTDEEAKLITGFIMHQKMSDLVYAIENSKKSDKQGFYTNVNNMNYRNYAEKYLVGGNYKTVSELEYDASLYSISDYLKNNDNYKIYHSLDDYLVNSRQLKQLKKYSGQKTILMSNGSHLGYLYRKEFQNSLRKNISQKSEKQPRNEFQEASSGGI